MTKENIHALCAGFVITGSPFFAFWSLGAAAMAFTIGMVWMLLTGIAINSRSQPDGKPRLGSAPTEWEYGYETCFVRAARFNGRMGWGIEFELPRHPNECDRADMLEWIEEHGALILQCGGSPGAPIKTIVRDIHDRDSANAWMMKILPEFHAWIRANLSR